MIESSQENPKKRKGRNDLDNRDFICPCGKSYLSYPALFIHVKQKHDGKPPGQLIKPKNQNTKRGRPKGNLENDKTPIKKQKIPSKNPITPSQWLIKLKPILDLKQGIPTMKLADHKPGKRNCIQILTLFKNQCQLYLTQTGKIHLNSYLQFVRSSINKFFGKKYDQTYDASQIIDCSNMLATQYYQQSKQSLNFSQEEIISLTKTLFQWLYLKQFTNHVLEDNNAQIMVQNTNSTACNM